MTPPPTPRPTCSRLGFFDFLSSFSSSFPFGQQAFSLVELMVVLGLLGGVSLGVMKLTQNMSQTQKSMNSQSDEMLLRASLKMILDDERHCRVSFAGNGEPGAPTAPLSFYKTNLDEEKKASEGLNMALYLSNQVGNARSKKKFNGKNFPEGNDLSTFGSLTIKSMKLYMNNGVGSNYSEEAFHGDVGLLRVVTEKKISGTKKREKIMDFDISLRMSTNASGLTKIISCKTELVELKEQFIAKENFRETLLNEMNSREGTEDPYDFISPGSFICSSGLAWNHHDSIKQPENGFRGLSSCAANTPGSDFCCVAPRTGYYQGVDFYRGGVSFSFGFYARKGDRLRIVTSSERKRDTTGFMRWHCYKEIMRETDAPHGNGKAALHWGDNGCYESLSNYGFIYAYHQKIW